MINERTPLVPPDDDVEPHSYDPSDEVGNWVFVSHTSVDAPFVRTEIELIALEERLVLHVVNKDSGPVVSQPYKRQILRAKNPSYDLEFYDESIRAAVDSQNAEYIKPVIREKIGRAGVVLCLVSVETYISAWVDWELETAINLQKPIVAMAVKGLERATLPAAIRNKVTFRSWSPGDLDDILDAATVVPQ